jgi:hypothetical protein
MNKNRQATNEFDEEDLEEVERQSPRLLSGIIASKN